MIPIPACVVCVAPTGGHLRDHAEPGADIEEGAVVAVIDAGGDSRTIHAPRRGRVGGVLVASDQRVGEGEGVVWLSR